MTLKLGLTSLFMCLYLLTYAQGGTITYNQKYNWLNIMGKLPYLSQEEKDRMKMVYGKNDDGDKGDDYILTFNDEGNIYQRKEKEDNYGYSWGEEDDILIRDTKNRTTKDIRILLGKKYLIEDEIPKYRWKILNELKDVAGYVCMKAETRDTVNNIHIYAWFTDKIPYLVGPEGFTGLPGTILALDFNDDDINITATKVQIEKENVVTLPIPKKIKGKKITYEEYFSRKKKHITLSVAGRRNPYWEVRY